MTKKTTLLQTIIEFNLQGRRHRMIYNGTANAALSCIRHNFKHCDRAEKTSTVLELQSPVKRGDFTVSPI